MKTTVTTPSTAELPRVIDVVASWQVEGLPVQVHPGDLGWYERFGAESLAAALRVWTRGDIIAAVGFLDESELIRMAIAPNFGDDTHLARDMADDFAESIGHLLPPGTGVVEARFGPALQQVLTDRDWTSDEPWTPLQRDLTHPVPASSLRIEVVGPDLVADRVMVESAAFPGASLSADRWHLMASGYAYRNARCIVGYDDDGAAVAATTVWSAGRGRPGVIEPLGVHGDHRGRGYGASITLAAADALRGMGCSSAAVATPSSNAAAVATYKSAGFVTAGEVTDFCRPAL